MSGRSSGGNIRRENNATSSDLKFLFGTADSEGTLSSLVRGSDSELIVYFAGHGSKEGGKPYLLGIDTRPSRLAVTGYSLDLLLSRLDKFQKKYLPDGRVTVILESCFSGRSHAGELITGTSAPAFGPPILVQQSMPAEQSNVVVMAAAQGNQYAVWDTEYRQSVFTDALVSGLHGEADSSDFGGNADGKITLAELDRFVSERIGRRLKNIRPGASQIPEFIGTKLDETLVETASVSEPWREQFRRTYGEELKVSLILSNPKKVAIEQYLGTCLYCPKRTEIRRALSTLDRMSVSCEIEQPIAKRLIASGTFQEISSFQATCRCCNRKIDLASRLASLQQSTNSASEPVPGVKKAALAAPSVEVQPAPAAEIKTTNRKLARAIQKELKRVGCYPGRIDGDWGKASGLAISRFNQQTGMTFNPDVLSEAMLKTVSDQSKRVCPVVCRSWQKLKGNRCTPRVRNVKRTTIKKKTVRAKATRKRKSSSKKKTAYKKPVYKKQFDPFGVSSSQQGTGVMSQP